MDTCLQILIVLLLILLNGVFAMSELALVSARRARLAVLERKGLAGAATARQLAEDPQRFLPTVQVGITLVGVLTGVFGGARIASHLERWLARFPDLAPAAGTLSLAVVVVVTTYLTLVLGELVPKQLALRRPEQIAARLAAPIAWLARIAGPVVWLLGHFLSAGAAAVRPAPRRAAGGDRGGAEGAGRRGRADRRAGDRGARHDRARAAAGRQAGARHHDAAHRADRGSTAPTRCRRSSPR